jgi:hypothetical protein
LRFTFYLFATELTHHKQKLEISKIYHKLNVIYFAVNCVTSLIFAMNKRKKVNDGGSAFSEERLDE